MNTGPRFLFIAGALLIVLGIVWQLLSRLPGGFPLGKLPGDIAIEKENFRFYFPLTTSILVSVVLSLIAYLVRYFSKS
ncbi:MAG: DUF2905 domain-containing protein [Bdellovibrionia bacterium]